jgi:hypothetical protein
MKATGLTSGAVVERQDAIVWQQPGAGARSIAVKHQPRSAIARRLPSLALG